MIAAARCEESLLFHFFCGEVRHCSILLGVKIPSGNNRPVASWKSVVHSQLVPTELSRS